MTTRGAIRRGYRSRWAGPLLHLGYGPWGRPLGRIDSGRSLGLRSLLSEGQQPLGRQTKRQDIGWNASHTYDEVGE